MISSCVCEHVFEVLFPFEFAHATTPVVITDRATSSRRLFKSFKAVCSARIAAREEMTADEITSQCSLQSSAGEANDQSGMNMVEGKGDDSTEQQRGPEDLMGDIESAIEPLLTCGGYTLKNLVEAWDDLRWEQRRLKRVKKGEEPKDWKVSWIAFHEIARGLFNEYIGSQLLQEGKRLASVDLHAMFEALEELPLRVMGEHWAKSLSKDVLDSIHEHRLRRKHARSQTPEQLQTLRAREERSARADARRAMRKEQLSSLESSCFEWNVGSISTMDAIIEERHVVSPGTGSMENSVEGQSSQLEATTVYSIREPYAPEGILGSIGDSLGFTGEQCENKR